MNIAFAPVTILKNVEHLVRTAAHTVYNVFVNIQKLGYDEFMPHGGQSMVMNMMCAAVPNMCEKGMSIIVGPDHNNLNKTRLSVYTAHFPAGTSVKNMLHYGQLVRSGFFRMYDYGVKNVEHYGDYEPPSYDLKKCKVPTVLVHGMEDWLATPKDVAFTASQLPNLIKTIRMELYNHMDFIWGMNAHKDIYQPVIHIMKQHLKNKI